MKENTSVSWRKQGDSQAFEDGTWEFKSRQFESSARFLLKEFDDQSASSTFERIMFLPTAEFLLSLAVELICKAYYLKRNAGPKEEIFTHEVLSLCDGVHLNPDQRVLMQHAQRYVEWAGRYPTPKWTKEVFKEEYDVPSSFVGDVENIDFTHLPNTASRPRADQLLALYQHILNAWREVKK